MTTIPSVFFFDSKNGQLLNWIVQDPVTLLPITGATLAASLYWGRALLNPDGVPGAVDPNFSGINLPYIGNLAVQPPGQGTAAQYTGTITAAFDPGNNPTPTPYGSGYVLVVDMTASGYQPQHWEIPAVVQSRNR